jgi:hypothetical protein
MVKHALTLLAAASTVLGATPPGFQPAAQEDLVVQFGNLAVNGQVVQRNCEPSTQRRKLFHATY